MGYVQFGQDDRVRLALEWLNIRAESPSKGYVNGADVRTAADLFSLPDDDDDEESVTQRLFREILKGGAA